MKLSWIIRAPLSQNEQGLSSDYAGVRMRTIMPVTELRLRGHEASITLLSGTHDALNSDLTGGGDVAIFGPVAPARVNAIDEDEVGTLVFELIDRMRKNGVKIVADIHDNHFTVPGRSRYLRRLVQTANAVVANTDVMAGEVRLYTGSPVYVIGDPFEGPQGSPKSVPTPAPGGIRRFLAPRVANLNLAWFGHHDNLRSLYKLCETLGALSAQLPLHLAVVSRDGRAVREFCAGITRQYASRFDMEFIPWSLAATWQALRACDLVVLPNGANSPNRMAKSANRIIESLRAGRFPIVNPVASYMEFQDYAWVGDDISKGIVWAVEHAQEVLERTSRGQNYVEEHYGPATLGKHWERVLREIAGEITLTDPQSGLMDGQQ